MPLVDLAVVLLYLAGVSWLGARCRRRQRGMRDYFLTGQRVPWWAVAASIVATETSTVTVPAMTPIGVAKKPM